MLSGLRSVVEGVTWPALPDAAGSAMLAALFQFERSQWMDEGALWALQRQQLRKLLEHAVATSSFHRSRLEDSLARLSQDFSREAFATLPLLTRRDLQLEFTRLRSDRVPASHGAVSEGVTSGSTGEPVRFCTTDLATFFWHAGNLRDQIWHGRDFAEKTAAIRMGGKLRVEDNWFAPTGHSLVRTGPLVVVPSEFSVDAQLNALAEHRPAYVVGYANNIRELALASLRRGLRLPSLREARTFGEQVTADHRRLCREAWDVPLTDIYTTREAGYLALQCPAGEHYHAQSELALVEVIDDAGRPCRSGQWGRVVVTVLHNFAMPLIRYDLGDFAEVGGRCNCGRGLSVLKRLLGRSRNMLRLEGGGLRWPAMGTAEFLDAAPIRQFRFVQKAFDRLEANLLTERPLTVLEEAKIADIVSSHLGIPLTVSFVYHKAPLHSPSGKLEDFVSELP